MTDQLTGNHKTLRAIEAIRRAREPAAIAELMPLGLTDGRQVRAAAREAIRELLELVPLEALPLLDEALRRAWGYFESWRSLRPESVLALASPSADDRVFVRLVASHRNGYVRSAALRLLSADDSPGVIPFLLLRLVDWVDPVRSRAEEFVRERLRPEFADGFVNCLPLLDRLAGSTRLNPAMVQAIHGLLCDAGCALALRRGMDAPLYQVRRHCFRLAAANAAFGLDAVLDRATLDSDVKVRLWAFGLAIAIPDTWGRFQERARRDAFAPIRRIVYDSLEADPGTPLAPMESWLMDPSAAIRQACQQFIDKSFHRSAAEYYRIELNRCTGRTASICVRGLAETGNAEDGKAIAGLLGSTSARTRVEVIRALRKLGADEHLDLISMLKREVLSVAREAATSLLLSRRISAVDVWRICHENPAAGVPLGILRLFGRAGKWEQMHLYLEASGHVDPLVSAYGIDQLRRWIDRSNSNFTQPSASDRSTLPFLFDQVRGKLPSRLERELRFVFETECQC